MDQNLIFLLKICQKLEIGVFLCSCKEQCMKNQLYVTWLLSKMTQDGLFDSEGYCN